MTVQNNTDLLLKFLSNISEAMYSKLLYKKFSKLLEMNLKSFHIYLSGCKFQTVQMKNMKYLSIKSNENTQIIAHHSCILGRSFIERYTIKGQAIKELRQRQKEIFLKESSYLREQKRQKVIQRRKRLSIKKILQNKLTLAKGLTNAGNRKSRPKTREKGESNYEIKSEPSRGNKENSDDENNSFYTLDEKDSANYESDIESVRKIHLNFFSFLKLGSLKYDKQKIEQQKEEMKIK